MEPQMQQVVVKTFTGATEATAAEQYAADAVVAARLGYGSTSQTWDGTKLTVVYERLPVETDPMPAASETRAEANAKANQERAAANAQANQERAAANAWANQERAATNTPSTPPPPPSDRTA